MNYVEGDETSQHDIPAFQRNVDNAKSSCVGAAQSDAMFAVNDNSNSSEYQECRCVMKFSLTSYFGYCSSIKLLQYDNKNNS